MPQKVLKSADPKKVRLAQDNLIAYHRLFAGVAGIDFVEKADIVWNATKGGDAPGNQILRARFGPDTAEQGIEAAVRQIGRGADRFDWTVFPACTPADLKQRVEAYGRAGGPDGAWELHGEIGGMGGTWMLMDLEDLAPTHPLPNGLRIERVLDDGQLEVWRQTSCDGFGGGPYDNFYAAYRRHGYGAAACALHYVGYLEGVGYLKGVGYLDGRPVNSSTLVLTQGMAGIYNVSTPPAHRRRGYGAAITWHMLDEARARGHRDAFVWSSPMGKNAYQSLGFAIYDFGMREYQWRRRRGRA